MSKVTEHLNVISIIIAGVSALVAMVSVYFTYGQLSVAVNQQKVITDQQAAATKLEDLRFVGRISVDLDESSRQINVSNYSDLPLTDAAVWTLGLAEMAPFEGKRLDTIRAPLAGLGACRTMTFSVDTLIKAVEEHQLKNIPVSELPETSATEPFVTFKVPSGSWYTVSETEVYREDGTNYRDSMEAVKYNHIEQLLPDTVLEGDISDQRTLESDFPLGPAAPVTMSFLTTAAEVTSNGCSGPGR